jgi:hypothetical protein
MNRKMIVDIEEDLHSFYKAYAGAYNKTIKELVTNAMQKYMVEISRNKNISNSNIKGQKSKILTSKMLKILEKSIKEEKGNKLISYKNTKDLISNI